MPVEREALLQLLRGLHTPSSEACAQALLQGAEFEHWDSDSVPAAQLAVIYRRRAKHARRVGLAASGIDEAVKFFEAAEDRPVSLAIVHGAEWEYPVFLAADGSSVVACLTVPVK